MRRSIKIIIILRRRQGNPYKFIAPRRQPEWAKDPPKYFLNWHRQQCITVSMYKSKAESPLSWNCTSWNCTFYVFKCFYNWHSFCIKFLYPSICVLVSACTSISFLNPFQYISGPFVIWRIGTKKKTCAFYRCESCCEDLISDPKRHQETDVKGSRS